MSENVLRRIVLVLNSIVIGFFVCFLAYTIFARSHLDSLARDFVTKKTLEYSKIIFELTKAGLDAPLAQQFFADDEAAAIRKEIANYECDTESYVADLTRRPMQRIAVANENALAKKVIAIKDGIREYYDETLNELIADLRIFSTTNLIAGIVAFFLAYRPARQIRQSIVWFSFLMFVAVAYCSYLYVDDLTFFRILFRLHMGWWYPMLHVVVMLSLVLDFGRYKNATEKSAASK